MTGYYCNTKLKMRPSRKISIFYVNFNIFRKFSNFSEGIFFARATDDQQNFLSRVSRSIKHLLKTLTAEVMNKSQSVHPP